MKQLTDYIIEKANFIVKKHITDTTDEYTVIIDKSKIDKNTIFKVEQTAGIFYVWALSKEKIVDKNAYYTEVNSMFFIRGNNHFIQFNTNFNLLDNAKFLELTDDEIEMMKLVKKYKIDKNITSESIYRHKVEKNGTIITIP